MNMWWGSEARECCRAMMAWGVRGAETWWWVVYTGNVCYLREREKRDTRDGGPLDDKTGELWRQLKEVVGTRFANVQF